MKDELTLNYTKKELPSKYLTIGISLTLLGAAIMGVSFMMDAQRASFNALISFMFLLSVGLGSLFFVALEHLIGAEWSKPFRRIAELFGAVIFVLPILAIPLFMNLHGLFEWTHHDVVQSSAVLKAKSPYLNENFFYVRSIVAFVLMAIFYYLFAGRSFKGDKNIGGDNVKLNGRLAAGFMPVFAISLTAMAIDWMMSLEPHWFSTIYGVYYFAGTFLAALAVITFVSITLNENGYMHKLINRDHYYNFGALLFAFTNFWAYIAFSQFLLIWYSNIPEETFWFLHKWEGGWPFITVGLILVRFIVPYAILLPQPAKSSPKRLKIMAIWILVAHFYDLYWLIMPTYAKHSVPLGWQELATPILCAGVLIFIFSLMAKKRNLLATGDPKLLKGLHFHL